VALNDGDAKPAESITVTTILFEVVVVASVLAAADAVLAAADSLLVAVRTLLAAVPALLEVACVLAEEFETLVKLTTAPFAVAFQYAPAS
jgi:hypothetical protein